MKVCYRFKDKKFDSLKDIVENNKLKPDYEYLFEEFLLFQGFISKKTFYSGVKIEPSIKYDPLFKGPKNFSFTEKFFTESIRKYLVENDYFAAKNPISTLSGGIDSSALALEMKPKNLYSGYYNISEFDERNLSKLVAKKIKAKQIIICLNEDDFLNNIEEYSKIMYSPVGGMGGVMEFSLLKKIAKEKNIDVVVFGNGGDEIFMGYYFNYFVKNFYEYGFKKPRYMENFLPSKIKITKSVVDHMIIASLNRTPNGNLNSEFVTSYFLPYLKNYTSIIDKVLAVNINCTLPTILHAYNQYRDHFKIKMLNPLANNCFIKMAKCINTPISPIPKQRLRELHTTMPKAVRENYIKKGFPMPIREWKKLNEYMRSVYDSFFRRNFKIKKFPYIGINRYSWGIFQTELFLRNLEL